MGIACTGKRITCSASREVGRERLRERSLPRFYKPVFFHIHYLLEFFSSVIFLSVARLVIA